MATEDQLQRLSGLLDGDDGQFETGFFMVWVEGGRTDPEATVMLTQLAEDFGAPIHGMGNAAWWQPWSSQMPALYEQLLPYFKTDKHKLFKGEPVDGY